MASVVGGGRQLVVYTMTPRCDAIDRRNAGVLAYSAESKRRSTSTTRNRTRLISSTSRTLKRCMRSLATYVDAAATSETEEDHLRGRHQAIRSGAIECKTLLHIRRGATSMELHARSTRQRGH
ncbi:MAG: hypothetical protein KatS3mg038_1199 [Candidatus Kapaibacterium sp.]|nr:MAG: hypothetical protein KatS3mg038_1199 [Candidatus Kapabacteria bacterium]